MYDKYNIATVVAKNYTLITVGTVLSVITGMFGGWNNALTALMVFMVVDWASGMALAFIFHKSNKTESGKLKSSVGFKGLAKKGMIIGIVLVGRQLDVITGNDFIMNGIVFGYLFNEGISILENVGLMGLPVPPVLRNSIELLSKEHTEGEEYHD